MTAVRVRAREVTNILSDHINKSDLNPVQHDSPQTTVVVDPHAVTPVVNARRVFSHDNIYRHVVSIVVDVVILFQLFVTCCMNLCDRHADFSIRERYKLSSQYAQALRNFGVEIMYCNHADLCSPPIGALENLIWLMKDTGPVLDALSAPQRLLLLKCCCVILSQIQGQNRSVKNPHFLHSVHFQSECLGRQASQLFSHSHTSMVAIALSWLNQVSVANPHIKCTKPSQIAYYVCTYVPIYK